MCALNLSNVPILYMTVEFYVTMHCELLVAHMDPTICP